MLRYIFESSLDNPFLAPISIAVFRSFALVFVQELFSPPLTLPQHLLPAFDKEGITDDVVRALALVDLKALGLTTMAQAIQFKTCVAEFLSEAEAHVIEKPSRVAAIETGAAAPVPLPPPAIVVPQPPVQQPHRDVSNVPAEYTDQCAVFPAFFPIQTKTL